MPIGKTLVAMAVCLAVPAQAADWQGASDMRGGFVGARVRLALGGGTPKKVETMLTIAPTRSQIRGDGRIITQTGEGLTLNFNSRKPQLMLGGTPADRILGFRPQGTADATRKSGLSTGAWIGIGVGVVAVAAVIFVATLTCVGEDPDYCGSD